MKETGKSVNKITSMGLLSAVVAVLAMLGSFIKIGPFPITLTLCPIIIGAAVYGPSSGALLGLVVGIANFITGLLGWDGGAVLLLFEANPVMLIIMCLGKTTLAGFLAGAVYRKALPRFKSTVAVLLSGIVCPVTNTGVFIGLMLLFWTDTMSSWAGGSNVIIYAITGLAGVNFVIELVINMVLAAAITAVIRYANRHNL